MPITLTLPPNSTDIEIGQASFRAARFSQTMAMAYALQMRGDPRPHWLTDALRELNEIVELLDLRLVAADPVDALFERANVVALANGQVLR